MLNRTQLSSDIAIQKSVGHKDGDHVEPGAAWQKMRPMEAKPSTSCVQMAWKSPVHNAPFQFKKARKPPVPKITQSWRALEKDYVEHGIAKIARAD